MCEERYLNMTYRNRTAGSNHNLAPAKVSVSINSIYNFDFDPVNQQTLLFFPRHEVHSNRPRRPGSLLRSRRSSSSV